MKIGLVRHFKVNHPFPKKKLLSKSEVIEWFVGYDNTTNIEYKKVNLSEINWESCYSSPMIRTLNTARHIYNGKIEEIPELKELSILHRLPGRFKLPFIVWGTIVRIQSLSSNKDTDKFRSDIGLFLDKIIAKKEGDILIVSHWFVMRIIRQELIKRKFSTDNFKSDEYGTLYIFERADK